MSRFAKKLIILCSDLFAVSLACFSVIMLFPGVVDFELIFINLLLSSCVSYVFSFYIFDGHLVITRYLGLFGILRFMKLMIVYCALFNIIVFITFDASLGIRLIQPVILFVFLLGSRVLAASSIVRYESNSTSKYQLRVLVYGAGVAGSRLAANLINSREFKLIGFIDDNSEISGHIINGYKIYNSNSLEYIINDYAIDQIFVAIPSLSQDLKAIILDRLSKFNIKVKVLPSITKIGDFISISDLKDVDIEDILGRRSIPPVQDLLNKKIKGRRILVTGAGGSIGSELCRQIVLQNPTDIILIESCEYALYTVEQDLRRLAQNFNIIINIVTLIADVKNKKLMHLIINKWKPYTVYHAAAYKHVPLVELNMVEGLWNNVFGTLNVIESCINNEVENFVLISTDKAVRPTNVMGASKRLAEMLLQAYSHHIQLKNLNTIVSMVRFGNVLGSSGSVVPLFRRQIEQGGPITLTDTRITRYFMTIPEAAQLVIQAGAMAKGGEVFVLDMGECIKISDLAHRMIELSGLRVKSDSLPDGDIEIKVTGLRPGEKLYEELLIGDNPSSTQHPRIMQANEEFIHLDILSSKLELLKVKLDDMDYTGIRSLLLELVVGYQPVNDIVDLGR